MMRLAIASGLLWLAGCTAAVAAEGPPCDATCVASSIHAKAKTVTPVDLGDWKIDVHLSKLDARSTVATASLSSIGTVSNTIGRDEHVLLVIRCTGGGDVKTYIAWPFFIGTDNATIKYKIGDEPVREEFLGLSEDGTAIGYWETNDASNFAVKLFSRHLDHKHLVVGVSPHGQVPVEAEFDLAGSIAAYIKIADACLP